LFDNNLNPDTTYYWRTWHVCGDVDGPYTETWSFTTGSGGVILPAPNLITPADGSILTSLPETFKWTSVSGAIDYVIEAQGSSRWLLFQTTETQIDIGSLDPDTTYDWWVAAGNDYAIGDDSDLWQFNTPSGTLSQFQEDQIQLRIYSDGDEIVIIR
jgi:hypothetical protein